MLELGYLNLLEIWKALYELGKTKQNKPNIVGYFGIFLGGIPIYDLLLLNLVWTEAEYYL